jgi:hypothetical protein
MPAGQMRLDEINSTIQSPQSILFDALRKSANEFGYELTDASIESWHLHWMCNHGYDSVDTMVGRLKTRMPPSAEHRPHLDREALQFDLF